MYALRQWLETDEKKKDVEWANIIVRNIRWFMSPLVDIEAADLGMRYLFAKQNMEPIRKLFQHPQNVLQDNNGTKQVLWNNMAPASGPDLGLVPEMQDVVIQPFPLFEKPRNIITAEVKSMGILANVKAVDPTSSEERKQDKGTIENRKFIEGLLSYIYKQQGDPAVKMDHYQERFGQKPSNGNTEKFDELGLNPDDPSDVAFFMKHFHKLDHEIAAQQPIDALMKSNDVINQMDLLVQDAMAKKAGGLKVYVNDSNGMPTVEYLAPENIYIYGSTGRSKSFQDANAICYQQIVTVRQFLELIGDDFDFEVWWDRLIMSIMFTTNVNITNISPASSVYNATFYDSNRKQYNYTDFMNFRVSIGYVEWNSQNLESNVRLVESIEDMKFDGDGNPVVGLSTLQARQKPHSERYPTKARYEIPTYKAYYMPISTTEQVLFKFGKLEYQDIKGYNDDQSNFSIICWKEPGLPISLMCKERVDLFNEAYWKFKYEVRVAKASGRLWNFNALVDIAENVITDTTIPVGQKVAKIMEMNYKSRNEIYGLLTIEGRQEYKPATELSVHQDNGIPESAMRYIQIMVEQYQGIMDEIGTAPLREADPGNDRTPAQVSMTALDYSQKATAYIPDMITYMINKASEKLMLYIQDIITFGNIDTLAYNFLLHLVGKDCLDKIGEMGKESMRRYGIYIENLSSAKEKQMVEMAMNQALANKAITTAQYLLISQIKSPKEAFLTLAYLEQKNAKDAQKTQQQITAQQQQHEQQLAQMQLQQKHIEGDYMLQGKKFDYDTAVASHAITQQGGITKTAMKASADADNIARQAVADLHVQQAANNPNTPPPPQGVPAPPPPQMQQPQAPQEPMGAPQMQPSAQG